MQVMGTPPATPFTPTFASSWPSAAGLGNFLQMLLRSPARRYTYTMPSVCATTSMRLPPPLSVPGEKARPVTPKSLGPSYVVLIDGVV